MPTRNNLPRETPKPTRAVLKLLDVIDKIQGKNPELSDAYWASQPPSIPSQEQLFRGPRTSDSRDVTDSVPECTEIDPAADILAVVKLIGRPASDFDDVPEDDLPHVKNQHGKVRGLRIPYRQQTASGRAALDYFYAKIGLPRRSDLN